MDYPARGPAGLELHVQTRRPHGDVPRHRSQARSSAAPTVGRSGPASTPPPWAPTKCPCPFPTRVIALAADPNFPDEMYAALEVAGVIRSSDGWRHLGGNHRQPRAQRRHPGPPRRPVRRRTAPRRLHHHPAGSVHRPRPRLRVDSRRLRPVLRGHLHPRPEGGATRPQHALRLHWRGGPQQHRRPLPQPRPVQDLRACRPGHHR